MNITIPSRTTRILWRLAFIVGGVVSMWWDHELFQGYVCAFAFADMIFEPIPKDKEEA